ncbi:MULTISPECIES: hypothetical protein [Streptococcus]|uniref:Uncharacterized protein n=2 Tax=Streptococcus anginosus TaxID=1328 RepID=W1TSU9_STRAP|nr:MULTISPECIES: hypothetical protein [Streptococcus]ETI84475.1 MAG: hypothetical protein Q615_SPAC00127G0119 [Streptococcus anginosus DORA_7]KAA9305119.1 hypothetical protein F6I02_03715 [Streptococcus anginosus]KAA9320080.1 hypothetical protein F6H95_11305 [Streptococcus anginosus]MCW0999641.1 hypothetical protein [Streptococcus anginosus]MCW1005849.1 hypothetical protein [Streptococcus anginosus]
MKTIKMVEHKNETHEEYKARVDAKYENKVYKILQQNGKLPQNFSVVEIQEYDLEFQRKEYERIHELATSLVEFEKEHSYTPKMNF